MAIFKYTVANKESKKLSGTVEAPDEQTARAELNNLGFSILALEKTEKLPELDKSLLKFIFEALDKNSKLVTGTIPAKDETEASQKLTGEYAFLVTALWKENATAEEIENSRKKWSKIAQENIQKTEKIEEGLNEKSTEDQKKEQMIRTKIEFILKQIHEILVKFDKDFDIDQKMEINKKINKLLRIKNSTNLDYILDTAEELLMFIQGQEKSLAEKGLGKKQLELEINTRKLLNELKKTTAPKTFSEDIIQKIENWEQSNVTEDKSILNPTKRFIDKILIKIKNFFTTPPEIQVIKDQIKIYNHQLWEFIKLYFKEPTKEYKEKVRNSLKTIWQARKKAVHSLRQAKKLLKARRSKEKIIETNLILSFFEELNSLTGWLLGFYIIYYFVALYLTTKNFGLNKIPQGLYIYESHIFKYALVILFLLHSSISIKINFFKKNIAANLILPVVFICCSIIVLLNF